MARATAARLRPLGRRLPGDGVRTLAALGITLTLFFPAFFGDDSFNFMNQPEVDTLTAFFQSAAPGRVYSPVDNAPLGDTSKYNLFPRIFLFGTYGKLPKGPPAPDIAKTLALEIWHASRRSSHAYFIITPSMVAFNEQYEVTPARSFAVLRSSMARSPLWKVLYNRGGISIYELTPKPAPVAVNSGPPVAFRTRTRRLR